MSKLHREKRVRPANPYKTGEPIQMRKQMHKEKKDLITGELFTEIIILLIVGEKTSVHNEIKGWKNCQKTTYPLIRIHSLKHSRKIGQIIRRKCNHSLGFPLNLHQTKPKSRYPQTRMSTWIRSHVQNNHNRLKILTLQTFRRLFKCLKTNLKLSSK